MSHEPSNKYDTTPVRFIMLGGAGGGQRANGMETTATLEEADLCQGYRIGRHAVRVFHWICTEENQELDCRLQILTHMTLRIP
ncbi:unnamed protein product [Menidia menidia]|uniref:(Atlantic silverside) hypothetical protein n=1 Tax=Menidia menidia TaxID=238744 RepID=A0A8S4AC33_9TELE|nr:unnamed protein product [Menidia menidia]